MIPIKKLEALPLFHRETVAESHLDEMGHMNVRWYLALFDEAAWQFFDSFGMTKDYYERNNAGAFALTQHIRYRAEVRMGETVAIRARILGRSERRIHSMMFMINESTNTLAATLENVGAHADLSVRRTSPIPPFIAEAIDAQLAEFERLDWDPPLCGALSA